MAAAVIMIGPALAFFVIVQRYFIDGLGVRAERVAERVKVNGCR